MPRKKEPYNAPEYTKQLFCITPAKRRALNRRRYANGPVSGGFRAHQKRCRGTCGKVKREDAFPLSLTSTDGLASYCHDCTADRKKAYRIEKRASYLRGLGYEKAYRRLKIGADRLKGTLPRWYLEEPLETHPALCDHCHRPAVHVYRPFRGGRPAPVAYCERCLTELEADRDRRLSAG